MQQQRDYVNHDIFNYLEYKDGWLYWKETLSNRAVKGSKVISMNDLGYVRVGFKKKRYYAHRLIWELFNGPIPIGYEIDHIDGNPTNNLIKNLQCVPHIINLHSARNLTRNTTGLRGVSKNGNTWDACVTFKFVDYRKLCSTKEEAEEFIINTRKTLVQSYCPEGGK